MNKNYINMKNLIEKKYYPDIPTIMNYLDMFLQATRLSQDEYEELVSLAEKIYPPEAAEQESQKSGGILSRLMQGLSR